MSSNNSGRHRAPGRFSPAAELSDIVAKSAQPAVKTSAILVASGGLIASFALPASAAPSGAPAARTAAPTAVQAPAAPSPAVGSSFGVIGFAATAKPKPAPQPVTPRAHNAPRASRSTVRPAIVTAPTTTPVMPATGGVLNIAASLAGIMYRWGGTSPDTGFDCSGFTQYVFHQVGVNLPRTAEEQRQFATPVSNPQPGDLVFFGTPAYHMGIYAGNGKMWDSPRSGQAVALRDIWSTSVTYGRP